MRTAAEEAARHGKNGPSDTRFLRHELCAEKRLFRAFETDLARSRPEPRHLTNDFWLDPIVQLGALGRYDRSFKT
jgi:hypothetical protein